MQLGIRKGKTSFQTIDSIVLERLDGTEVVITEAIRGAYDEKPYTPKYTAWRYKAALYLVKDRLAVQVQDTEYRSNIVKKKSISETTVTERYFLSNDNGESWTEEEAIALEDEQPLSEIFSDSIR